MELATPGSAVRLASVARHVTDWATRLCINLFSKFYPGHSELMVKYNVGLKILLQQSISEPVCYGDLVYKFKRID